MCEMALVELIEIEISEIIVGNLVGEHVVDSH